MAGLRQYLCLFAKRFGGYPICALRASHIEAWFALRGEIPSSRASNLGRLSRMFSIAVRRGWIRDNPCARVERVRVEASIPVILKPRTVAKVFAYVRRRYPHALAWFALATFAGIRPQEIDRLRWDDVNLDEGVITVDAAASKVHQRRIVNLHPTAKAWLQYAKEDGAKLGLSRSTIRRVIRAVGKRLKLNPWPHDCLRKSCASYLIAAGQSTYAVADQLGNSPRILLRHYRQLVTRKQAEQFWRLLPSQRNRRTATR